MIPKDVSFHKESMSTIFSEEGRVLIKKHYLEIAHYQDIPLEPDEESYYASEKSNKIAVFTCRKEKKLIGYVIYSLRHNIHYKSSLQAVQDIIYIDREHRGFGMRFINWCDFQLKKLGVQAVYHHVKAKHDFGPALKRFGYELIDLVYGRRLDKEG